MRSMRVWWRPFGRPRGMRAATRRSWRKAMTRRQRRCHGEQGLRCRGESEGSGQLAATLATLKSLRAAVGLTLLLSGRGDSASRGEGQQGPVLVVVQVRPFSVSRVSRFGSIPMCSPVPLVLSRPSLLGFPWRFGEQVAHPRRLLSRLTFSQAFPGWCPRSDVPGREDAQHGTQILVVSLSSSRPGAPAAVGANHRCLPLV